ncbi:hypothetical protein BRDID11004_19480 [Bradyrhizobium diazoefficiens]|uniref:Transposase n=2 Tax=Bradyrhizobium diazoefficiens TaxID=1355477 RepID=A0A809XZ21_9BRAD|nr:hypothetical protein F07S3_69710 [Bradyrhizobium diazoefficiens]BCA14824.1 hypothetical protein BDHF08_66710 [Bradyrhizobium diazoefficiens]BCA23547.1 hypothetical protein BDHH15_67620 [Bradyrhizobium diazoefficiens]BCE32927.1 hypothetical protein XF2B_66960 [Bradyrhizobium diazoefficiens]BCE41705.1 hypothetical protein XF3B_67360 [Bradyrhizobium diazoefficiens]
MWFARHPGGVKVLVASHPIDFRKGPTGLWRWDVTRALSHSMVRNSLAFVSWKDRKAILPAITIYRAENADMALARFEEFEAEWGKRYPAIGRHGGEPGNMSCRYSPSPPASAR